MSNTKDAVERRRAERRRRIRRKRIITTLLVLFIISLITGIILAVALLFPVENITASGSKIYTSEQIIKASGITEENNLLFVNEDKLYEVIRKKLPYTDSVKIKKDLPNSLSIKVEDAKEYTCFNTDNGYYTVSKKGYVLEVYPEKPENLFYIECGIKNPVIGELVEIKKASDADVLKAIIENCEKKNINIDYIDITNSLSLEAKVCGRFIVNFGTYSNIDKKIAHLSGMLSGIPEDKTGRINLSMWTSDKTEGSFVEGSVNE
ncbi:MAG: FtsQ-type POTRA domain-containing protein [Clostridia bacterium]|nr:FtsQ-type POTRA domain-containing protein [Clostridia bacterium]